MFGKLGTNQDFHLDIQKMLLVKGTYYLIFESKFILTIDYRFANFAKQYIENPIVGIQIWNTEKCTVLRQREILHRRQTQLTLGELHPYFKKTLETAKVRPRTVSITLTNEEQKEYVEE